MFCVVENRNDLDIGIVVNGTVIWCLLIKNKLCNLLAQIMMKWSMICVIVTTCQVP
jgi:hypothetical protein